MTPLEHPQPTEKELKIRKYKIVHADEDLLFFARKDAETQRGIESSPCRLGATIFFASAEVHNKNSTSLDFNLLKT